MCNEQSPCVKNRYITYNDVVIKINLIFTGNCIKAGKVDNTYILIAKTRIQLFIANAMSQRDYAQNPYCQEVGNRDNDICLGFAQSCFYLLHGCEGELYTSDNKCSPLSEEKADCNDNCGLISMKQQNVLDTTQYRWCYKKLLEWKKLLFRRRRKMCFNWENYEINIFRLLTLFTISYIEASFFGIHIQQCDTSTRVKEGVFEEVLFKNTDAKIERKNEIQIHKITHHKTLYHKSLKIVIVCLIKDVQRKIIHCTFTLWTACNCELVRNVSTLIILIIQSDKCTSNINGCMRKAIGYVSPQGCNNRKTNRTSSRQTNLPLNNNKIVYYDQSKNDFTSNLLESKLTITEPSEASVCNIVTIKTLDDSDSLNKTWEERTPLSEQENLKSPVDVFRYLNLVCKKFDLKFWQEIVVYPFTREQPDANSPPGDPNNFMDYEIFRLCSFTYTRFPANFDVWVTQLAQAGFYCVDGNGQIICFDCGQEFQGAMNSPIENAHRPDCRHRQRSTPLHMWTQGLSHEVLAIYYNRYGSLRPYNFENADHVGMASEQSPEARGDSQSTIPGPQQNNDIVSTGTSLGRGSDIPAEAMQTEVGSVYRDDLRPQYHSASVPSITDETNYDYPFGNQRRSLPGNLNEVSGVVVSEESHDPSGAHQVLTSAARNPVALHTAPPRGDHSQDAQGGSENGAVGGADPAFDLSKASYPLFSSATERRQSFATWSPEHSHRPDDLVAAGFFYAGYADCVRCFYCGLGLKFWRETDIPAYQHARYRPHCVYNRMYKGQDYIDRVQQDIQTEQRTPNDSGSQVSIQRPAAQDEAAATVAPASVGNDLSSAVRVTPATGVPRIFELMDSPVAQTAMLNGWQRYQVQRAIEHIVREFGHNCLEIGLLLDVLTNFYATDNSENNLRSTNSSDSNESGIVENNLVPSNLASIRVPSTPEISSAVDAGQGVEVPDSIQGQEVANAALDRPPAACGGRDASRRLDMDEVFRSVEREHSLLTERTTCRICLTNPVSVIYLPCGHVIACQECAERATHCIFCSRQIIGTANVYLA